MPGGVASEENASLHLVRRLGCMLNEIGQLHLSKGELEPAEACFFDGIAAFTFACDAVKREWSRNVVSHARVARYLLSNDARLPCWMASWFLAASKQVDGRKAHASMRSRCRPTWLSSSSIWRCLPSAAPRCTPPPRPPHCARWRQREWWARSVAHPKCPHFLSALQFDV